ncbi:hypothetical protein GHT06_002512 [Daphnia sinensis]|uniref:DDE-1 domain-containing protein n=1 Tax=Daphnia sinensis TaxID=1820382 RepID=A0AAD5PKX0_9CRUS|nr:hypothetical protein GHT06_002512 [Daphnia sinensis]
MLKSGKSQRKIAIEFDISKFQVQQIGKNQEEILKGVDSGGLKLSAKVTKNMSENKELDDAVYNWFLEMRNPKFRCKPLSISRAHIQARALREAETRSLTRTFRNWRRRNEVGASVCLYGEAGDVDVGAIEPAMRDLRVKLANYDLKNIFNMVETGLFYRAMPARTYLAYNESRKTFRGTKALKAKDRVTLVLCVNVDGNPLHPPKNAWVDSAIYRHWWENIFLPAIRDWTDDPVALIMDNFSGHDLDCEDPTGQVSIFFVPPNSTSLVLTKFIEAYEDIERIQQLASCPANILDAGQIIRQSWDNLSESTILNCWRHSKCPSHLTEPSTPEPRPANYKQVELIVRELTEAISNVHISAGFSDLINSDEAQLVKRWISLEHDTEIVAKTSILISPCDSHFISQGDMDITSDPETELRLNLLKYTSETIRMPINDPVLLELAKKLRDHILNY